MVHQVVRHGLGSQVALQNLQVHLGNHLQIQDQELQRQELVQSGQQGDHVQQAERHQVQQPMPQ